MERQLLEQTPELQFAASVELARSSSSTFFCWVIARESMQTEAQEPSGPRIGRTGRVNEKASWRGRRRQNLLRMRAGERFIEHLQ